ncbi:MAG: hypothetical protein AAFY57_20560 [Cyanobacteria bacterium J06642_2]
MEQVGGARSKDQPGAAGDVGDDVLGPLVAGVSEALSLASGNSVGLDLAPVGQMLEPLVRPVDLVVVRVAG